MQALYLTNNRLTSLPESFGQLVQLQTLYLDRNQLISLPQSTSNCIQLYRLALEHNKLLDIPTGFFQLAKLENINLDGNPLNPELAAAYAEGIGTVKAYLRAKAQAQITLNETKLILVGEGAVGKTCLIDALAAAPWQPHDTTHGIQIRSIMVTDPDSGTEIVLNGWDFGGQQVYRPTHQLFFSAPAVYLVVWNPREGSQQGAVTEWIELIKHREPEAKILVVATHGGPQERQPDIDRQDIWDRFGEDTVLDFFHIDNKPDENGNRRGIEELKQAIARVAARLPEMGRTVPKRWQSVWNKLKETGRAYLSLEIVCGICHKYKMDDQDASLFVAVSHRLGRLIHYEHDPLLSDIVVLKPDWLATAISFVLDDKETRNANGLVSFTRLNKIWNDPDRDAEFRYPNDLHWVFLRLMERYDLSYRVAGVNQNEENPISLIAQLVPDIRPEAALHATWSRDLLPGDSQQTQICHIVDESGNSATATGLFNLLIVRQHKYSLGREYYPDSIHWQRGLVLDDDYNGRALLEYKGNDIHITVRAPYPQNWLARLTSEVKYLVESFWEGLRCEVMVPCIDPCGIKKSGTGLYEVQKLIESKRRGRPDYPCPVCDEWQDIDQLLLNAPAAQPVGAELLTLGRDILQEVRQIGFQITSQDAALHRRFDQLDARQLEILSKGDALLNTLIQVMTDGAKEGPRLFSLVPVDRRRFNLRKWTSAQFRFTLWCEHSRLPLPILNGEGNTQGVYDIEIPRVWFKKIAPYLKLMFSALNLVLPIAASGIKVTMDQRAYESVANQLDFGKEIADAALDSGEKLTDWLREGAVGQVHFEKVIFEESKTIKAYNPILREFHALLRERDPGFGGLIRVMNKRQEFLWVHPQFASEY
ncbi:MAG TPA: COR domain-containing protein [Aggregatilineaceae bacterium]|nr:COR domain-containing protein [Aggregatilineaceae bacterium]